jgi:hypothetical protein
VNFFDREFFVFSDFISWLVVIFKHRRMSSDVTLTSRLLDLLLFLLLSNLPLFGLFDFLEVRNFLAVDLKVIATTIETLQPNLRSNTS